MDVKFFFSYNKIQGTNLRDFRQQLEKQIATLYAKKPIKQIPEEFEVKLKYNVVYKIFFINKEYLEEDYKGLVYDPKYLKWVVEPDDFAVV